MPELKLTVSEQVFGKIRALSKISNLSSEQVTFLISESVNKDLDKHIIYHTQLMLKSIGVAPELLGGPYTGQPASSAERIQAAPIEKVYDDLKDDEDSIAIGSSLGASEEDFAKMDEELPDNNFVMPGEEEEAEEDDMPVKDKGGKEASYEDDYMNDLQSEVESDEFGEDPAIAAAAGNTDDADSDSFGDDTPKESDTPDVLPVDYGIKSVVNDDKSALNFFNMALEGKSGDKSKRNGVKRKLIHPN